MAQSSQEALKKWMPPESEGWIPETLWDEIILPCWLHQGFLVASRETDHGRKRIGRKDIHLLILGIAGKVGEPGLENRQDQKRKQHSITAKIKPKINPVRSPLAAVHRRLCLAVLPLPGTGHKHRPWTRLLVATALTLVQNVLPTSLLLPSSIPLSLLPNYKSGAGWSSLGWVPLTFGKYLVFSIYRMRRGWRIRPRLVNGGFPKLGNGFKCWEARRMTTVCYYHWLVSETTWREKV